MCRWLYESHIGAGRHRTAHTVPPASPRPFYERRLDHESILSRSGRAMAHDEEQDGHSVVKQKPVDSAEEARRGCAPSCHSRACQQQALRDPRSILVGEW